MTSPCHSNETIALEDVLMVKLRGFQLHLWGSVLVLTLVLGELGALLTSVHWKQLLIPLL